MQLVLDLSPETEAKLKAEAARLGSEPTAFAREVLEERLAAAEPAGGTSPSDRVAELRSWRATHPVSAAATLDDSRESIYADREA